MTAAIFDLTTPKNVSRMLFEGISWEDYLRMTAELDAEGRRYRSTFDNHILEIVVPGMTHERIKGIIARLLETYCVVFSIRLTGLGSTTFRSSLRVKGLEPDECYYVDPPKGHFAQGGDVPPTPDLAIEVDIANSSVPREPVYAALGVGELWCWRDARLSIRKLAGQSYEDAERSRLLPDFPITHVEQIIREAMQGADEADLIQAWFDTLQTRRR